MTDNVNHPAHYEANGPFECIELTKQYDFCLGNAIKYVWRHMDKGHPVEDLNKALWYIQREIDITGGDYFPAPIGTPKKLFTLSDMDYAHMGDFWYALYEGNLIDAKQEIQTRIEKLTANYRPASYSPTKPHDKQYVRLHNKKWDKKIFYTR